ncbi:hypothetical protein IRJ41_005477 [Triplophysa rosa]|uniref:BED-type domain-containing protein n=1 Tax=Triplophysa rosa TaxID=992332 RepID=A0A9W7WYF8_TRIRA|nr:hypothetical protein IRJ41_005477 [Triplophysa rosa]
MMQCKLCLPATKLLSASKESTSNLKKHLERMHPSAMQITSRKRLSASDNEGETSATVNPRGLPGKQAKLNVAALPTSMKMNALIFDFIIENVQPFSLIHSEFNIQVKVCPTVTENGSNFVKAFQEFGNVNPEEHTFHDYTDGVHVAKLHPQEAAFLKEYTSVLKTLAYAIDLLQGKKTCFLGFVIPTILGLKAKLTEKISHVQFSTNIILALVKSIDTRFREVLASHDAKMAACTIPKFRLWWLPSEERESMKMTMVQEAALLDIVPSAELTTAGNELMSGDMDDNLFSFEKTPVTSTKAEDEIRNYLQDPCKILDSLKLYPIIKSLFLKYNTTLPSSAPVEQLFSQGGLIFSPQRSSMTDEHFEHTLLLRYNSPYLAQVGE